MIATIINKRITIPSRHLPS